MPDTVAGGGGTAVLGDAKADHADGVPDPFAFTAATRNEYDTPLVKPVTIAVVKADAACENVRTSLLPSARYSIR